MRITQKSKRFWTLSLIVSLGLCATVPFNMGGCADATGSLGGMVGGVPGLGGPQSQGVGGSQTQGYLSAGTHIIKSATMSERDEKAMGQSVAMQVTSRYRITSEQKLNQYVVLVGLTLASSCERPDGNWFFAVVDNDQPNAFSGPDGYIFITRGALKQMQDESELAGVLAHEMTHVLSHHGLNAAKQSERTSAFTDAVGTQMKGAQQEFTGLVNGAADVVLNKGYDRPQEDQADAGAVQLLVAAGYDPNGYLNFLTRVASEQHGGGTIAAFSTHPDAAGRVAKVRSQIASAPKGGVTLKERFERMTK